LGEGVPTVELGRQAALALELGIERLQLTSQRMGLGDLKCSKGVCLRERERERERERLVW
jgi:hypothetical protein